MLLPITSAWARRFIEKWHLDQLSKASQPGNHITCASNPQTMDTFYLNINAKRGYWTVIANSLWQTVADGCWVEAPRSEGMKLSLVRLCYCLAPQRSKAAILCKEEGNDKSLLTLTHMRRTPVMWSDFTLIKPRNLCLFLWLRPERHVLFDFRNIAVLAI